MSLGPEHSSLKVRESAVDAALDPRVVAGAQGVASVAQRSFPRDIWDLRACIILGPGYFGFVEEAPPSFHFKESGVILMESVQFQVIRGRHAVFQLEPGRTSVTMVSPYISPSKHFPLHLESEKELVAGVETASVANHEPSRFLRNGDPRRLFWMICANKFDDIIHDKNKKRILLEAPQQSSFWFREDRQPVSVAYQPAPFPMGGLVFVSRGLVRTDLPSSGELA